MQFGTNHLGHFALTGLLLDLLIVTADARVVTASSGAHRMGSIRFDDLQGERGYWEWLAYGQSKLANLLFAFELQRKADRARARLISAACHPGYTATNLQGAGPRMRGFWMMEWAMEFANVMFAQSAAMGALPTLYAAAAPEVEGGDYIGPDGLGELRGHPVKNHGARASCALAKFGNNSRPKASAASTLAKAANRMAIEREAAAEVILTQHPDRKRLLLKIDRDEG